jgi:hypothetical protein
MCVYFCLLVSAINSCQDIDVYRVELKMDGVSHIMSKVWSVIKYKVKEGCEDEFVALCENAPREYLSFVQLMKIDDCEYAHICAFDDMDKTVDHQEGGLLWLDSITHLLEWSGDSRTESFSGFAVD